MQLKAVRLVETMKLPFVLSLGRFRITITLLAREPAGQLTRTIMSRDATQVPFRSLGIPMYAMEWFCRQVSDMSGQEVDWFYQRGRPYIITTGDLELVSRVVSDLSPLLRVYALDTGDFD